MRGGGGGGGIQLVVLNGGVKSANIKLQDQRPNHLATLITVTLLHGQIVPS